MGHGSIAGHGYIKSGVDHGKFGVGRGSWLSQVRCGRGLRVSQVRRGSLWADLWFMGFDFRWVPMGFGLEFSGFDLLMDFGMGLVFWIQILWVSVV